MYVLPEQMHAVIIPKNELERVELFNPKYLVFMIWLEDYSYEHYWPLAAAIHIYANTYSIDRKRIYYYD